jgi:hypothetical protein
MSQTGMNRTDADAILKDFYLPGVRSTMNNELFLLSQIETNTEDIEGRDAVISINTGRNEGVGARAEGGTLPTAGRQSYTEQRVRTKHNYGRIKVSGPVMRTTGSDSGSFVRSVSSETNGIVRDLRNDVARQTYGDGTGAIAVIGGAIAGAVVDLTGVGKHTMRQLRKNMSVDIGSVANPVLRGTQTIVSVDRANETITLAATLAGTTTGDIVFRHGSGGTGANQSEITGLKAQVSSTGALFGIDPADVPEWASHQMVGGAINENMYIEGAQEVNLNTGEDIDLWITTSEVHRATANLLTSVKRFPGTNDMKGGYTGLDMSSMSQGQTGSNTTSMVYDKDMVEQGVAYGLTTRRIQNYKMSDWEFMQEDGAILSRVPNEDAYEATLFCYSEVATDGRDAHVKITGITGTGI